MIDDDVRAIQIYYPQVYLACHARHQRAASTGVKLSANDSSLLSHLGPRRAVNAGELARHLAIGGPALSATIQRLVKLGYVTRTQDPRDRRRVELRLTKQGAEAMQKSSVLETERVKALLGGLSAGERKRAVAGLEILARAARSMRGGRR